MKRFAIVAWLATAVVVGCAAGQRSQLSQAPSEPSHPVTIPAYDPREEIALLDQQIDNARTRMGLQDVVGAMAACSTCPVTPAEPFETLPSSQDRACRPAATATCQDSCTLYDAICANAARICRLAQEMQGDRWAAEKCLRGTATCHAANDQCCRCQ